MFVKLYFWLHNYVNYLNEMSSIVFNFTDTVFEKSATISLNFLKLVKSSETNCKFADCSNNLVI